jgi:hypothetical protein
VAVKNGGDDGAVAVSSMREEDEDVCLLNLDTDSILGSIGSACRLLGGLHGQVGPFIFSFYVFLFLFYNSVLNSDLNSFLFYRSCLFESHKD